MLKSEDIQARLHAKPFKPFRIVASEGAHHDICVPDLVMVGRRDLMVGFPDAATPTIYDGVVRVALVHIVALEEIPVASKPANGSA